MRLVLEEHFYFIIGNEAYLHQKAEHLFECYPAELTGAHILPKPLLRFIFRHTLTGGKYRTFLHNIGWGRHSVETQVSDYKFAGLHFSNEKDSCQW